MAKLGKFLSKLVSIRWLSGYRVPANEIRALSGAGVFLQLKRDMSLDNILIIHNT